MNATQDANAGDARPRLTDTTWEQRNRKIAAHSLSRTAATRDSKPGSQPKSLKDRMPRRASLMSSRRWSAKPRLTFWARFVTRARRVFVKSTRTIVQTPATVGTKPSRVNSMTQPPTMATSDAGMNTKKRHISTMDTRSDPTRFASEEPPLAPRFAFGARSSGATSAAPAALSVAARRATSVDATWRLRNEKSCVFRLMSIWLRPSLKTTNPKTHATSTLYSLE
mmetsp:Transcript_26405/g.85471  ORF Transcript_26405/g.85471 Transcript_26405/m.85471 type:complete len:224 (+) Transcript_26405:824-1495(+)